jgi:hypothetical protein
MPCCCRNYGCLGFLFDIFMTGLTAGFWIVWIIVRETRRHSCHCH